MRHAPLLAALLAPAALAGEGDPTLADLTVNGRKADRAPPGAVVVVRGTNLHSCVAPPPDRPNEPCPHEGVSVEVGSTRALLLDAGPGSLQFIVPHELRPGKTRLLVRLRGRSLETPLTILAPDDPGAGQPDDDTFSGDGPQGPPPGALELTRFALLGEPGAWRFRVEGKTVLPDRFALSVGLAFQDPGQPPRELEVRRAEVKGGAIAVELGPYAKELLRGIYAATFQFELGDQAVVRARQFLAGLPEAERRAWERVVRRDVLVAGTPEETRAQAAQLREAHRVFAERCDAAMKQLRAGFGSASRSLFRAPNGPAPDLAKHREHLLALGFTEAEADAAANDRRFSIARGHFIPVDWAREAEKTWVPALVAAWEEEAALQARFLAPLDPRLVEASRRMVGIAGALFRAWNDELHAHSKLTPARVIGAATSCLPQVEAPSLAAYEAQRQTFARLAALGE